MKHPIKVREVIKDACLYVESNAKLKKLELNYSITEKSSEGFYRRFD